MVIIYFLHAIDPTTMSYFHPNPQYTMKHSYDPQLIQPQLQKYTVSILLTRPSHTQPSTIPMNIAYNHFCIHTPAILTLTNFITRQKNFEETNDLERTPEIGNET